MIIEASKRYGTTADGTKTIYVDHDVKAYIESELALKILLKYDLTRKPKRRTSL